MNNNISRICNSLIKRWRMPESCFYNNSLFHRERGIINHGIGDAAFHSPSISYLNLNNFDMNYKPSCHSFHNNKSFLGTTFPSGNSYNQYRNIRAAAGYGLLKKTMRRPKTKRQLKTKRQPKTKREPYSLILFPIDKGLTTEEELKEHNTETSHEILGPGMILLKNHISLADQVEIVEICQEYAIHPAGYFRPRNYIDPDEGIPVQMMCFGKDWDPETKYIVPDNSDVPEAPPIPDKFISVVKSALQNAQALVNSEDELPSMSPDTCMVNFYRVTSHLDLHQDCDESSDSLNRGLPVVSISIGDTAEFLYGNTADVNKANKVVLESGDVLIFGGKSRHLFHGVKRITEDAPEMLFALTMLRPGRLNLTFKQF